MIPADVQTRFRSVRIDLVVTSVAALLFGWALWTSFEWSFSAALFPRMVTALGITVALLHLIVLLVRPARPEVPVPEPVSDNDQADGEPEESGPEYAFGTATRGEWLANCGWIIAFIGGIYVIGLFLTAPFFTFAYLRFAASASWRMSVIYAVVIAAVLFGFFDQLLHIPMPLGVVQE